jgi:7-carboxy-7-deazaguanine synthase
MDWQHLERLSTLDEVQFVVDGREDYLVELEVTARHDLATRVAAVHLSPVHGVLEPRVLAEWALADRLPARIQLQLHKYIWDPQTRGV